MILRILLALIPFSMVRSLVLRLSRQRRVTDKVKVLRAVMAAGRWVPTSNCLSQALTAWVMLRRAGYEPMLRIGVSTGERFEAHAWVECDGVVVIGGHVGPEYYPLQARDVMLR